MHTLIKNMKDFDFDFDFFLFLLDSILVISLCETSI